MYIKNTFLNLLPILNDIAHFIILSRLFAINYYSVVHIIEFWNQLIWMAQEGCDPQSTTQNFVGHFKNITQLPQQLETPNVTYTKPLQELFFLSPFPKRYTTSISTRNLGLHAWFILFAAFYFAKSFNPLFEIRLKCIFLLLSIYQFFV